MWCFKENITSLCCYVVNIQYQVWSMGGQCYTVKIWVITVITQVKLSIWTFWQIINVSFGKSNNGFTSWVDQNQKYSIQHLPAQYKSCFLSFQILSGFAVNPNPNFVLSPVSSWLVPSGIFRTCRITPRSIPSPFDITTSLPPPLSTTHSWAQPACTTLEHCRNRVQGNLTRDSSSKPPLS